MSGPARRPRGAPGSSGGQFASHARGERAVELGQPTETAREPRSRSAFLSDVFRRFPDTEFSTHRASGSAEGWVQLSWDDGPRETAIRSIGLEYHGEHPYRSGESPTQGTLKGVTTSR